MRTPTPMIVGIVLGPCGLVLNLTSTLAPTWRNVSNIAGKPYDMIQHQGIWDICEESQSMRETQCGIEDNLQYFSQKPVQVAKGLMPASLAVTVLGLIVASSGVRCWKEVPNYLLAGLSGLVLFISGLLSLIAVSWYNNELYNLPFTPGNNLEVGYCLVVGYLGSCLEIIGGSSLTLSFVHCYKERKMKKAAPNKNYSYPPSIQGGSNIAAASTADNRDFQLPHRTPAPRSYTNSLDVLEGENTNRWSRFPCDSDL